MATFEFLKLVKESSYGTVMSNPVAGTDSIYIRLTEGNSFSVQPNPQMIDIMYGGGEAIPVEIVSDYFETRGRLQTVLYPTQAALLFHWITDRINTAQTSPWVTSEPAGDLASVSLYHAYAYSNGTFKRTRYAGCKAAGFTLAASRGDPVFKLSIDLWAQKPVGNSYDASTDPDAVEFPAPVDTDLPTGPYTFNMTSGGWTFGTGAGTVRSQYEGFNLTVTNKLDARSFESRFLQVCAFRGRTPNVTAAMRLKATPDDRASFEAVTPQRSQLVITKATNTVTIDMKASNVIRTLGRDLPIDKVFMFNTTLGSVRDAVAGTDFTVTCT